MKDQKPMKSLYIGIIGPVVSLMLITVNVLGQTVPPPTNGVPQQLAALQVTVSNLQATVMTQNGQLQGQVAALIASNNELSHRLQYVSLTGQDMYITGANLHIVNGNGSTYGTANGLGNLIVGYNESRGVSKGG